MAEGFSAVGDAIGGADFSGLDTSWLSGDGIGSSIADGASSGGGFNFGSLPIGTIFNTLGRLGSGIGAGVSAYQSGQQSNYYPYTRWLGNGLAMTGLLNNMANKQNQLDQAYGSGRALSSMFGNGYSLFGNGKYNNDNLGTIQPGTLYNTNTNDIYGNGNSIVSNAINDYMRY